ncbi:MAG TPA: ATP-binding protein [Rhizomicrobium sp.]|nr:ATP-binding protein [Rhizomicrobium sp.]
MDAVTSYARERLNPLRLLVELGPIAVVVYIATYAGLAMIDRENGVAPIWLTNAFIIYFALQRPRSQMALVIATGMTARFFAGIAAGSVPVHALVYSICNLSEVLMVALPLRALNARRDFSRPKTLITFYLLAAGPAPLLPGLFASYYAHLVRHMEFLWTLENWYAADGLGLILIVPILFTVRTEAFVRMFKKDQILETLLYIGAVVAAMLVNRFVQGLPLAFLFFPAVLFLTFQRSFEGGAIGTVLVAAYLISPVFFGEPLGGLRGYSLNSQILTVEIFVAVIGFSVVLVGAALNERRRLEESLSAATERAQSAREEAIVAKEAAEKANRMKSMFLATMSHELRTPLNAVIGFSQLMEEETFGPLGSPRYREYTSLVQKAGRHLLELINDILDMSKIEAGKFELHREKIDLRLLVGECAMLMFERAKHGGILLEEDIPAEPLQVEADRRAIKQILLNLLSNAVKFTPAGGRVTVRASAFERSVALSVSDTGVGIPADQLYRLGNPFVQLRNHAGSTHEGTGLGLALVRSLAEMHGGQLKIESIEGRGTTVTVEIPVDCKVSLAAA